jgi:hypothetical protein
MNLTSPPPVEQLDPEYAADLKHDLVRKARKRRSTRWTPYFAWVPIVAATAAIAVITTTAVDLSRSGSTDPAGPAGVLQVPANQGLREWVEIGKADDADARAAARQCLTPRKDAYGNVTPVGKPSDVDTAAIKYARWIKAYGGRGKDKQLLQTLVTKTENAWFQCLDGEVLRWGSASSEFGDWEKDVVFGTWSWEGYREGKSNGVRASYSFRTKKNVELVELRIRGEAGVSPWYSEVVVDQAGYITGVLADAVPEHGKAEIDVCGFDAAGKQVFFKTFG